MSKQEEVYSINDELIDQKDQVPVKSNKIKYTIAIITGIVMAAAVSILLVGHFKFNWFKSETYKIKANISRAAYQANYFSEQKDMIVKASFANGQNEEKKFIISSNFVVVLTDRKELKKGDFLNTAALVILDSQIKTDEEKTELTKFSIFDETTIKELEENPNGSKYPIGIFTFYEDGTLGDIKVPDNMDKYNAESIVELIKNVIPKLTRNRTEDISNGLEIKEKKNNKVKTIIENQALRTYEKLEGTKYSKIVERDIEDDKISNIRVHSTGFFQSEEKENVDVFGLKDFSYDQHSEINSMTIRQEKETAELIQKISKSFNFITSEKLIENIFEKERKEKEFEEVKDLEEDNTSLRNLGFNFNVDKTFNIKSLSAAGQTISIKYRIAVQNGKAINQIIIDSNIGTAKFGNDGVTAEINKSWSFNKKIFAFKFPPCPLIGLNVYASGNLNAYVKFTTVQKTSLQLGLGGSLNAAVEIAFGAGSFAKVAAGAEGTLINASGYATITGGSVTRGYKLSRGKIKVYVTAYVKVPFRGKIKLWDRDCTIFNGWST